MPRRCILINPDGLSNIVRLADTEGRSESYLALSYVWGSTQKNDPLTRAKLATSKRGILTTDLPRAMQDAIDITMKLGFRYLWVDRYCIVQDDLDDCAEEISMLAEYYENAALTMAIQPELSRMDTFSRWGCQVFNRGRYCMWWTRTWILQEVILASALLSADADVLLPSGNDVLTFSRTSLVDSASTTQARQLHSTTDAIVVTNTESSAARNQSEAELFTRAQKALEEGLSNLLEGRLQRASAELTLCRDLLGRFTAQDLRSLQLMTMATASLGTCYHLLYLDEVASEILGLFYERHFEQLSTERNIKSYA